jgi:hypothetical protein
MNAKAQYYQHTYDAPLVTCNGIIGDIHVFCNDGLVNRTTTSGTSLIGYAVNFCFTKVNMVRAFNNGAKKFHYGFELSDNIGSPTYVTEGNSITELSNGSGYAVTGNIRANSYTGSTVPGGSDILFMIIDTLGIPTIIKRYDLGDWEEGLEIIESQITPGQFYICGFRKIGNINPYSYAVVMKVNGATGAIIWEQNYDLYPNGFFPNTYSNRAHSLVEYSPSELWIVGEARGGFGNNVYKGLLFSADPATGNIHPTNRWHIGFNAGTEYYNHIKKLSTGELLIGGTMILATPSPDQDYLLFKYDPIINVILWGYRYPFPGSIATPYPNEICYEVVERLNANQGNIPEYYAVGRTDGGVNGFLDMVVLKVDNNGIPKGSPSLVPPFPMGPARWFDYGTTKVQNGYGLDLINNNAIGDGIISFGTFQNPSNFVNMYAVKAYFNGASPCNTQTPLATKQNIIQPTENLLQISSSTGIVYNLVSTTTSYTELNLCFAPTVPWGNNAKMDNVGISKENTEGFFTLYPNPIVDGSFTLEYYSKQEGTIQITLFDALGRLAYSSQQQVSYNKNVLNISLPNSLNKGFYFVTIKQGEVSNTKKIAIQ